MFESFQSGRYKVAKKLGEGGKGIVFKAEDTRLGRTVAIKVIKGEGLDQESFARFEREAQATARLSHPHIVTFFDIGQEDESHYLVLEYIDGSSLKDLINSQPGGRCNLAAVLRIGIQVCQALEYAHSHGFLHRDIKPENIMITSEGVAKLMDFGLAKALDGSKLTQRGIIVGTIAHLPPERALGKASDARSDLYSLGSVLFEMVTGRPPFLGEDSVKVIFSHINDLPVMPRKIAAEVPEALEQVILKLLNKDPDKRYQSAGELLEALRSIEVAEAAPGVESIRPKPSVASTPLSLWAQPFVGREEEMKVLRTRVDTALRGEGSLVFITGEAGIGKTRLAHELGNYAKLKGVQLLIGRGYKNDGSIPYRPWVDLIKEYLHWAPPQLLFKVVGNFASEMAKLVPEVADKLGTVSPSTPGTSEQQRLYLFQSITGFFTNISREGTLILSLDDLQWVDEASLQLLHHLIQNTVSERLMVVGAYRNLELEDLRSLSRLVAYMSRERLFHHFLLKGLGPNHVSQILCQTLGQEVSPELTELIYGKTEGNPFYVEEVLRLLIEEGAISLGERGWEVKDISQTHIPRGIKALVQDRLELLEEECRQMLAIAAVIGKEFSFSVLLEVSEIEEDRLVDLIEKCLQARLVVQRRIPGEEFFAFVDSQVMDVLYEGISPIRRSRYHRRVGEALEKLYADKIKAYVDELAHHFLEGNDPQKAVDYSIEAGDKAANVFAWQEAIKRYLTAMEFLEEGNREQRAAVMQKLTAPTFALGNFDDSLRYAELALELYEALGDKRNALNMHMHIQLLYLGGYWDGAREDKALKHLQAIATIVAEDPDNVEKGLIYQRMGHLYLHRGQPATALAWVQKAEDLFVRIGTSMVTSLGTALTYTGRIDEGIACNEENWGPVLKAANPLMIGILGHELSLILALVRDIPRAMEWGERILPEITKAGLFYEGFLRRPLILIHTLSGNVAKAEEVCQVEERIESKTLMGWYFEDTASIGCYYLRQGDWHKAREYLEWAISVHRDRNNLAAVCACSLVLGSLHLELGDHPKAEELLLSGLNICQEGGNILFELWVLPAVCELYVRMGQLAKASEYIARGFKLLGHNQNWYGLPAPVYLVKGMLATTQKNWKTAIESFNRAIQVNRQYKLPWDEGKALYECGLMYLARGRKGDREKAHDELDQALAIFQRIGAKKEAEKVLSKKELLGA